MFVTLEGIDRSGKTTQAEMLAAALGKDAVLVREPGGTEAGERIRTVLKDPRVELGPRGELMLFLAARAELVRQVIEPALAAGRDVVCDRFVDSTVAYQGAAIGALHERGAGEDRSAAEIGTALIESISAAVTAGLVPDLTLLVRVAPEVAAARGADRSLESGGDGADRFELRGVEFQRQVAAAYDELARRHPERIVILDGERPAGEVHERALNAVAGRRGAPR